MILPAAAAFLPLSLYGATMGTLPDRMPLLLSPDTRCMSGRFVEASVVQTPEARAVGLSGRAQPLSSGEGMLFSAPQSEDLQFFWMKDTLIPLTVLFFDSRSRLLSADDMSVEPDPSRPGHLYSESRDPWVALEIAGGEAAQFSSGTTVLCAALG